MSDSKWLNVREAAAYLAVGKSFLDKRRMEKFRHLGPAFHKPSTKKVLYSIEDLDAWAASCRSADPKAT